MSEKNANPYNEGSLYNKGFAFIRKNQIVTRSAVVSYLVDLITAGRSDRSDVPADKREKYTLKAYKGPEAVQRAAEATATVLLSPRAEGTGRGDCRGNASANGHIYFMDVLKKEAGEEKRFRLRWRKTPLDKKSYARKVEVPETSVPQEKTAKSKSKSKAEPVTA